MVFFLFIVHTANILGAFTNPFEFEGDLGPEINPIRQKVFSLVMTHESLARNLTDAQIRELLDDPKASDHAVKRHRNILITQAVAEDRAYGPTLAELVPSELLRELPKLPGFTDRDLKNILYFIFRYGDQKIFRFLHASPKRLLAFDELLPMRSSKAGTYFDLPILASTGLLRSKSALDLKRDLLYAIFTKENLSLCTKEEQAWVRSSLANFSSAYLEEYLGEEADLEIFCTPVGQGFFYWLANALDLHLVASQPTLIDEINLVKSIFAQTLANPIARAEAFREKLLEANTAILFTQECDAFVQESLTRDGLFLKPRGQNPQDGCFVFLRSDVWEDAIEVISIDDYPPYLDGRLNVVLAMSKDGREFLLASGHGHSTRPEDGRLQITCIMDKFHELAREIEGLQLLIGMDANTKSAEDVRLFRELLDRLGLTSTDVGPTTIKRRMVTTQHAKAGRIAIDEEDYLITLQPSEGGLFSLSHPTVGFKIGQADCTDSLPNFENPSDHYPIGATFS